MKQVKCETCGRVGGVRVNSRQEMRCVWCAAIITSKPYEVAELNPFVDPAGDQKLEGNQPQAPSAIDATDAARELAAENGIDLAAIEGTGKDGLITVGDVRKAIAEAKG